MNKNFRIAMILLATLVLVLAVNLVAGIALRGIKIDMTQERLYTLTEGSRELVSDLRDDVRLKLYYSRRAASSIPPIKTYADRVIELLKQYESMSGGSIALEIYEPRPDTELEEAALRYGLTPVSLLGTEDIFFGLAIVSEVGAEESIPFLDPNRESFLEYDLSRLISSVANPEKKIVGIVSSLGVMGGFGGNPMAMAMGRPPAEPWTFTYELQNSYEVRDLGASPASIDPEIDVLLVIHPKNVTDKTEYAIDQFLLGGGRAIILVDPLSEHEKETFQNPDPNARFSATFDSDLPKLFENWGIKLKGGKVMGDLELATEVQSAGRIVRHPAWLSLGERNCNAEEIVSSGLEQLLFVSPGILTKIEDSPYEITTIFSSSEAAGEFDAFRLKFGGAPDELRRDLRPGGKVLDLAYKITGKFESAFGPAGLASDTNESPEEGAAKPEHMATAEETTTVIVVADVDFLSDDYSVRKQNFFGQIIAYPLNNNLNFIANAVDNLAGSKSLIGLRTRGKSHRPFTRVDEIERSAQREYKAEEDALSASLDETNRKLSELQRGEAEGQPYLSPSQLEEINRFETELADTKRRLREVRRNLRQDIERLGFRLKVIHIAVIPLLVLLCGFIPPIVRAAKMR